MAFDSEYQPVVGEPTKLDDWNALRDNAKFNYRKITGRAPEDDSSTDGHTHTGTAGGDGELIPTEGIEDDAVTEDKIADTDLPNAFRAWANNSALDPVNWDTESFDPDENFDLANDKYETPSNGVYFLGVQMTFLPDGGPGTYIVEIKKGATVIASGKTSPISDGNLQTLLVTTLSKLTIGDDITVNVSRNGGGADPDTGVAGEDKTFFYGYKLPWTTAY
jgi:hypothetical protein